MQTVKVENDTEVKMTKDYMRFKRIKGNRKLYPGHVEYLRQVLLDKPDMLSYNPILVNERFEIIDGQHLTYDEAVALLPDGDDIHTFVNPGGMLMGADWDRGDVLDLLKTGKPELSGGMAESMGHGIVAWREVNEKEDWVKDPVFIQTAVLPSQQSETSL